MHLACGFQVRNGQRQWQLHKQRFGQLAILLVLVLVAGKFGRAQQEQVAWEGTLRNPAGAPIADARLTLTGNGVKADTKTDPNGRFRVTGIVAGQYKLSIEAAGKTTEYA